MKSILKTSMLIYSAFVTVTLLLLASVPQLDGHIVIGLMFLTAFIGEMLADVTRSLWF